MQSWGMKYMYIFMFQEHGSAGKMEDIRPPWFALHATEQAQARRPWHVLNDNDNDPHVDLLVLLHLVYINSYT